jgi:16S rRNA (guanine527-N7)-methyltransferase
MFHVEQAATDDLLYLFEQLKDRNKFMNLVGPDTLSDYWERHVLDSAQLLNHAPQALSWADLGAGAGFPGLVLAILFKHGELDDRHIYLVDSSQKRCHFLQNMVDELNLPATVVCARAESLDKRVDIITARALAPLTKLLGFSEKFFQLGAQAWFLKGQSVTDEINLALKLWRFDVDLYSSLSDPRGRLANIRRLERA